MLYLLENFAVHRPVHTNLCAGGADSGVTAPLYRCGLQSYLLLRSGALLDIDLEQALQLDNCLHDHSNPLFAASQETGGEKR